MTEVASSISTSAIILTGFSTNLPNLRRTEEDWPGGKFFLCLRLLGWLLRWQEGGLSVRCHHSFHPGILASMVAMVVEAGGFQQDNNNQNQLIRFLFPDKLSDTECQNLFGCDHQGLYEVRDTYIIPFLATPGPGGGQRLNISLRGY